MNIMVKNIQILKRYMRLSYKNLSQFPIEFFMNFIMLFFDIATIFLFWISLFDLGILLNNWTKTELLIFIAINIFSEAISKLTFGFRDLEYSIIDGSFDKYLLRPINPIKSVLLEKLNVFMIISKISVSIIILILTSIIGNIQISNIFIAFTTLIIGTLSFELIYGTFSLLAFWFGKVYTARELVFSFKETRKYPIDIFPKNFINLFTYVIPLAFLATIPTKILLDKYENSINYLIIIVIIFILLLNIFKYILKKALLRYNSTGC